jgi:formylglycine-generating enzyme required for sulfatase activity
MKTEFHDCFIVLALFVGVHSALAQVTNLGIAPAGGQSVLYWPVSTTNYVLQTTTNLATPNWVTATDAVPLSAVTVSNTSPARFFRLYNINPPAGMVLIPAGAFTMGDTLDGNINGDATPINVTVSAFYMDVNLVSLSQWQSVYSYATSHGYGFVNTGSGKAANHPVQTVDWYDCVKWSNARSVQAGLTPVYYTDASLTQVYTNGELTTLYPNWAASGYRLPTEAEWEKAARGGLSGQRFPWGNLIGESQANYYGVPASSSYDLGNGYNAIGNYPATSPGTSPVGSFPANGYGLYDMAGNVFEWCWDWYGMPYAGGADPHGPTGPLSNRVMRGGAWGGYAVSARCAFRVGYVLPSLAYFGLGFRCVRGL